MPFKIARQYLRNLPRLAFCAKSPGTPAIKSTAPMKSLAWTTFGSNGLIMFTQKHPVNAGGVRCFIESVLAAYEIYTHIPDIYRAGIVLIQI
jgi:hypothetical protein